MFGYDVVLFSRVGGEVVESVSRNFACLEPEHEIPLSTRIVSLELPFADSKTVVATPAVVLLHEVVAASGPFSSGKCIENIETVQAGVVWQRGADHRCKACSEIEVQTMRSETPGRIVPVHLVISGVRVPPSSTLYFPPPKGPDGLCFPSFGMAPSL